LKSWVAGQKHAAPTYEWLLPKQVHIDNQHPCQQLLAAPLTRPVFVLMVKKRNPQPSIFMFNIKKLINNMKILMLLINNLINKINILMININNLINKIN
jgi:hypothetical protein